jgi:hypothetical protein
VRMNSVRNRQEKAHRTASSTRTKTEAKGADQSSW